MPPDREPGHASSPTTSRARTRWRAIIQRLTGQPLTEYLRPRLFDPLGIGEVGWHDLAARPGAGLQRPARHAPRTSPSSASCTCNAAVGTARSCSPRAWVAEATSRQIDNPNEPNPDWRQGYGFQFWMSRHGYRGDGAFGQFCVVLPEQDAVIAMTAGTDGDAGGARRRVGAPAPGV